MPRDVRPAARADIHWTGAPTLALQDHDGAWHTRQLTPAETCAAIKKLAAFLAALHPPANPDRTHETHAANPDLAALHHAHETGDVHDPDDS